MIRIALQKSLTQRQKVLVRTAAVCSAIMCSMLVLVFMGLNPFKVYANIFSGCFGTFYRFKQVVYKAVPLTILSLGCCVAFKMKFWNIGAEGQFYMGAFAATWAFMLFPNLPSGALLPLMALFALVAGGRAHSRRAQNQMGNERNTGHAHAQLCGAKMGELLKIQLSSVARSAWRRLSQNRKLFRQRDFAECVWNSRGLAHRDSARGGDVFLVKENKIRLRSFRHRRKF